MVSSVLASIGLQARSETRLFLVALARELKARHGSIIHLYVGNAQEAVYYRGLDDDDLFASLTIDEQPQAGARVATIDEAAAVTAAQAWEARLGETFNRLAVSDRHLGRGYALGGFRHPRSCLSEGAGYAQLLNGFNEALAFWDREIVGKGLTCLLNGRLAASLIARDRGVPQRIFAGARYRSYHYWAQTEFFETPEFEAAYEAGEAPTGAAPTLAAPYDSHLVNRAAFLSQKGFGHAARRAASQIARYAWWCVRGYDKAKGYYLAENLRYFFDIAREWRSLDRLARTPLAALAGKPFVFYPLHMEPEMALQGLSPEYFYQLSLIAAISRELPAGVRLAVKETPAGVGRRPRDFYRQITDLKNVVWLNTAELGLACVREAQAVVTITGTAGYEGAVMGKPVLTMGRHNIYGFLPHVDVVTDESRLGDALRAALGGRPDPADDSADGQRFLNAVVARSFDMRGYDFKRVDNFDAQCVSDAADALERSLGIAAAVPVGNAV